MYLINETLYSDEAKKKFREMVMKYHPDKGGDVEKTQRINAAKESGDDAIDSLYDELMLHKKTEKKEERKPDNLMKEYFNWSEDVNRWLKESKFTLYMMVKKIKSIVPILMGTEFILSVHFEKDSKEKDFKIRDAKRFNDSNELFLELTKILH